MGSDEQLMLQVRDGDAAAFEELMLRYQNRVMDFMRDLTGAGNRSEELAQEVFMRVYRSRRSYSPGPSFCTWLFAVARGVAASDGRQTGTS